MERHAELFSPTQTHLAALAEVERLAWASQGENISANTKKIEARVRCFSAGITLATVNGVTAGSQYSFRLYWDGNINSLTSWDDMTANGWYDRTHHAGGNTGFLVGVGVIPNFRGERLHHNLRWQGPFKLSELLIARTLDLLFTAGVKQVIGNARIPGYHLRTSLDVETYCNLRREDNKLFDPVLRFHERMGAHILKPVPYSLEDAESRNAGCWVVYKKPFEG